MLRQLRALWNPDMYHGWGRQRSYFEGWYFKVVAPRGRAALAFIPGIAMDAAGQQEAFIQVLDGLAERAYYYRFAADDFRPAPDRFALHIGDNYFSTTELRLALPDFRGHLQLQDIQPWPRQLGAPGVMGWYSFVPFMQCYHGVVSLDHHLHGTLEHTGQRTDFSGGRGYTEKDWGRSFPSSWIWAQSNHFDAAAPASLMVSVARIPWLGSHFVGFLCGLLWEGRVHRLATYTGARLSVTFADEGVRLVLRDRHRYLEITGQPGPGGQLATPLSGQMTGKVSESLQATLAVRFTLDGRLQYDGPARYAGLEVAGPARQELIGRS